MARSMLNQGKAMMLCTYTSQPMSLPCINFLHFMVLISGYSPAKFLKSKGHYDKVKEVLHLCPKSMSLPSINFLHLTVSEI